jgi:class 3 adenylate cyclase
MAQLRPAERVKLPDRDFAYIDSTGKRRLPIVDAAHVRNALARFNQVDFESDRAREQARERLLRAAKKFRIVPVGFISSQLRSERELGAADANRPVELPTGFVTLLMSDIEGSTPLLHRLGDRYGALLGDVFAIQRAAAERFDGCVVEVRADEFFVAFECPQSAVEAAIATHRDLANQRWHDDVTVRVRVGIHAGYPTMSGANYIGMAVHTAARICSVAHGGQIVISGDMKTALTDMKPDGVRYHSLGTHRLRGIPDEVPLFQIGADGLDTKFPALRL